jgi:hypothetical protein
VRIHPEILSGSRADLFPVKTEFATLPFKYGRVRIRCGNGHDLLADDQAHTVVNFEVSSRIILNN